MDVETTQVIEELGSRIDRVETSLRADIKDVRREVGELRGEVGELRGEVGELREGLSHVREDLAVNWDRTKLLFEALRDDIKKLGEGGQPPPRKRRR